MSEHNEIGHEMFYVHWIVGLGKRNCKVCLEMGLQHDL